MDIKCVGVAAALTALAGTVCGQVVYNDSANDLFDNGFAHLDILSVTLHNDLTNLYATINVRGDAAGTDWGKYLFMFDSNPGSGRADNPWGRNVDTAGRLNDIFVGSWVDQNPDSFAQVWGLDGGGNWDHVDTVLVDRSVASAGAISYTFPLSALGLSIGQTVFFDVMTTGGGTSDPGVDHLSRADMATPDWGTASVAGPYLAYTVIPSPGAAAVLAFAALGGLRRRR